MNLRKFNDLVEDFKNYRFDNLNLTEISKIRENKSQIMEDFSEYFDDILEIIESFIKNDYKFS